MKNPSFLLLVGSIITASFCACTYRQPGFSPPTPALTGIAAPSKSAPEIVADPTPRGNPTIKVTQSPSSIPPEGTPTAPSPALLPSSSCDQITILSDTTISDGAVLQPGEVFVKAWKVQNTGTCNWTTGYRLFLYQGDTLGAPNIVIPYFATSDGTYDLLIGSWPPRHFNIKPGEIVDLVTLFRAPTEKGIYSGIWALINDRGERVDPVFWVSINVINNLEDGVKDPWQGYWMIQDPYKTETMLSIQLFRQDDFISSFFYEDDGEMNLLYGWTGKSPLQIKGEYGSPSQPAGHAFIWKLKEKDGDQFTGINDIDRFTSQPWCGSRPWKKLPDPCLFEDNEK